MSDFDPWEERLQGTLKGGKTIKPLVTGLIWSGYRQCPQWVSRSSTRLLRYSVSCVFEENRNRRYDAGNIRCLVQNGADVNVIAESDKTPLDAAYELGDNELVELLHLKGAAAAAAGSRAPGRARRNDIFHDGTEHSKPSEATGSEFTPPAETTGTEFTGNDFAASAETPLPETAESPETTGTEFIGNEFAASAETPPPEMAESPETTGTGLSKPSENGPVETGTEVSEHFPLDIVPEMCPEFSGLHMLVPVEMDITRKSVSAMIRRNRSTLVGRDKVKEECAKNVSEFQVEGERSLSCIQGTDDLLNGRLDSISVCKLTVPLLVLKGKTAGEDADHNGKDVVLYFLPKDARQRKNIISKTKNGNRKNRCPCCSCM